MNFISRLFKLDWLPKPSLVYLRDISHDEVIVKSAYRAVSTNSTANWVEGFVRQMANDCKTKNGKNCCLSFLKTHVEWKICNEEIHKQLDDLVE